MAGADGGHTATPYNVAMRILFHVLAAMPLVVLQGLGQVAGSLLWWLNTNRRRIAVINTDLCLPELPVTQRTHIARQSIAHEITTYLETPQYWLGNSERMKARVREYRNIEAYDRALSKGKGVILLTLHMGAFEAVAIPMSEKYKLTGLYSPQDGVVNELSIQGRSRLGGRLVSTESGGARRQLLPVLARGEGIYFMPDHDPPEGRGLFAPFMGILAHTPSLVARLVRESGSPVVFMFGERLPRGRGYIAHYLEAPPGMDDPDPVKATTAMNQGLEACVRACPEQYWWGYKRFRRQPAGKPRFYT